MNSKLVILHCIASMEAGGAERQLCYLVSNLVQQGFEIHVAILKEGPNLERLRKSGAIIHKLNVKSNYDFSIVFQLIKLIVKNKIQIVHVWQRPMDVFGSIATILSRRKLVMAERSSPAIFSSSFKGFLRNLVSQFANAIVSNSLAGQIYWQHKIVRKIPILFLPNIVPFEEIDIIKPLKDDKPNIVVAIGRLDDGKNFATLINAFSIINKSRKDVYLYIIGDGKNKETLVQIIRENKLEKNVTLLGYKPNVWEYIKSAKLYVSVSLHEGMPNTVIESAALKIPMLLSDIKAHTTLFNESHAYFVEPTNSKNIGQKILEIIEINNEKQVESAYKAISHFSGNSVSYKFIELYKLLILN